MSDGKEEKGCAWLVLAFGITISLVIYVLGISKHDFRSKDIPSASHTLRTGDTLIITNAKDELYIEIYNFNEK